MFAHADTGQRAAFIAGLHALADFLAANPAIPVPPHGADILLHVDAAEHGGRIQVRQLARQLGGSVIDETPHGGHCYATRSFGPLSYRVVSIPDTCMARHHAFWSYAGSVDPEGHNSNQATL